MNNFEKIKEILKFENKNDFYFIQILKRRKDNPEMDRDVKVIKSFYIFSQKELDDLEPIITTLCENENARAYIRLNRRNLEAVGFELLKERIKSLEINNDNGILFADISYLTAMLSRKHFDDILSTFTSTSQDRKLFDSVCGSSPHDKDKTWIVDIDYEDVPMGSHVKTEPWDIDEINEMLINLQTATGKEPLMIKIPTKNGYHLITRPFNIQTFGNAYRSRIDVHKDNPTILYCK